MRNSASMLVGAVCSLFISCSVFVTGMRQKVNVGALFNDDAPGSAKLWPPPFPVNTEAGPPFKRFSPAEGTTFVPADVEHKDLAALFGHEFTAMDTFFGYNCHDEVDLYDSIEAESAKVLNDKRFDNLRKEEEATNSSAVETWRELPNPLVTDAIVAAGMLTMTHGMTPDRFEKAKVISDNHKGILVAIKEAWLELGADIEKSSPSKFPGPQWLMKEKPKGYAEGETPGATRAKTESLTELLAGVKNDPKESSYPNVYQLGLSTLVLSVEKVHTMSNSDRYLVLSSAGADGPELAEAKWDGSSGLVATNIVPLAELKASLTGKGVQITWADGKAREYRWRAEAEQLEAYTVFNHLTLGGAADDAWRELQVKKGVTGGVFRDLAKELAAFGSAVEPQSAFTMLGKGTLVFPVKKVVTGALTDSKFSRFLVLSAADMHWPVLAEARWVDGKGLELTKGILLGELVPTLGSPMFADTASGIELTWEGKVSATGVTRKYNWKFGDEQATAFEAHIGTLLYNAHQRHAEDRWKRMQIKAALKWNEWQCDCSKHHWVRPSSTPVDLDWDEFVKYWECMNKKAVEDNKPPEAAPGLTADAATESIEAEPIVEEKVADEPTGECTAGDLELMNQKGGGHEDGTLPKIASNCGGKSWGITGWKEKKMTDCMVKGTGITPKCGACFSLAGDYGFKNCKRACMSKWCGSECLKCSAGSTEVFRECIGGETPQPTVC